MNEFFGVLSGIIVIVSIIPYGIRTFQRKIDPNPTSWFLWTLIALALLANFDASGAKSNIWPAVFGFSNPLIILVMLVWQKRMWERFEKFDKYCLVFGIVSLGAWWFVKDNPNLAQYSLLVGIIADSFAAIPTIKDYWSDPDLDRPIPWFLFAIGYSLSFFAIEDHTFANYVLPAYMVLGSSLIGTPLLIRRIKQRVPVKEWI